MRLIDADRLMAHLMDWALHDNAPEIRECMKAVEEQPTVVDPVKHGRWDLIDSCEPMRYGCSVCHRMVWHYENYCPNCGAKMDEEDE